MAELTVAAGLARGLVELAVSKGANATELARRAGLAAADLEDVDRRIPFGNYVALMRAGQDLADDPALALHYGETNDMARISVVGLIAYACETMLEVMAQLNRYGRLVVEVDGPKDRFSVTPKQGELWVVDNRENPNAFPELTESTFARMICGPRRFGVTQLAKSVHVTHPAPPYRAEYERIYGCPVTFEADWNAVQIDQKWLSHPVSVEPRYAFGILTGHSEALLADLERSKTVRGRTEAMLMPVLHKGDASMDAIAARMGVSRQTLFRQLRKEGVSFEKVVDELRRTLALRYLESRRVSVSEAAYLTGFAEPAAFSRAFKRWTGENPGAYRARTLSGVGEAATPGGQCSPE